MQIFRTMNISSVIDFVDDCYDEKKGLVYYVESYERMVDGDIKNTCTFFTTLQSAFDFVKSETAKDKAGLKLFKFNSANERRNRVVLYVEKVSKEINYRYEYSYKGVWVNDMAKYSPVTSHLIGLYNFYDMELLNALELPKK